MKDFIVVIAFLILGAFIFGLILSDDSGSLKTATKGLMEAQVQALS